MTGLHYIGSCVCVCARQWAADEKKSKRERVLEKYIYTGNTMTITNTNRVNTVDKLIQTQADSGRV